MSVYLKIISSLFFLLSTTCGEDNVQRGGLVRLEKTSYQVNNFRLNFGLIDIGFKKISLGKAPNDVKVTWKDRFATATFDQHGVRSGGNNLTPYDRKGGSDLPGISGDYSYVEIVIDSLGSASFWVDGNEASQAKVISATPGPYSTANGTITLAYVEYERDFETESLREDPASKVTLHGSGSESITIIFSFPNIEVEANGDDFKDWVIKLGAPKIKFQVGWCEDC